MIEGTPVGIKRPDVEYASQVVWEMNSDTRKYSLVRVHADSNHFIRYTRPQDNVDISIVPTADRTRWNVRGMADIKALADLRLFKISPTWVPHAQFQSADALGLESFGDIAIYDSRHALINFELFNSRVRGFLQGIWYAKGGETDKELFPRFTLDDRYKGEHRVIPQVTGADPSATDGENLQVIFY